MLHFVTSRPRFPRISGRRIRAGFPLELTAVADSVPLPAATEVAGSRRPAPRSANGCREARTFPLGWIARREMPTEAHDRVGNRNPFRWPSLYDARHRIH